MTDPRMIKLAQTMVNYSIEVKPGDWVRLTSEWAAEPLAVEIYRAVIQAGGNCTTLFLHDEMQETFYKESNDDQLKWVSPIDDLLAKDMDCSIYLRASTNTRNLSGVDPARQQMFAQTMRASSELRMKRAAEGSLRWTMTNYPCAAFAQEANMSLSDFEDFVYKATYCDKDDPIAEWQRVSKELETILDWLKDRKEISVKSPHADLTLSVEDRVFHKADGHVNMPDGEVYTSPVEESVNGWVEFTYPAIREGREVEGVRLEFKDGKVVKASADKNEDYLISQIDTDEGSRFVGEFAIGTNYGIKQFTKNTLFDEKIGGSFHMALGAGYPETGSKNKSGIHWDFICDMRQDSEIRVDGELFYKDGEFQI